MRTPLETILFESDGMKIEEIRELMKGMIIQKKRWLGTNHPDNRVRVEAFKSSGVNIGEDVFISIGMVILDSYKNNVYIGDRCAFGNGVSIVSSSGPNNSLLNNYEDVKQCIKTEPVYIENDCWICSRVTILPGTRIGEKSLVGAGCVVNKDLEPYGIYVGVPVRRIRRIEK